MKSAPHMLRLFTVHDRDHAPTTTTLGTHPALSSARRLHPLTQPQIMAEYSQHTSHQRRLRSTHSRIALKYGLDMRTLWCSQRFEELLDQVLAHEQEEATASTSARATSTNVTARDKRSGYLVLSAPYDARGRRRRYSVEVCVDHGYDQSERDEYCGSLRHLEKRVEQKITRYLPTDMDPPTVPLCPRANVQRFSFDNICHALNNRALMEPPVNEDVYVSIDDRSISNYEFLTITASGSDGWLHDSTMNMALSLLAQQYEASKRRIAIVDAFTARGLYWIGVNGDIDENNFAYYPHEKALLKDVDTVLIPISDGFAREDIADMAGTHWSLVAIDLRDRNFRGRYFDSWLSDCDRETGTGRMINTGYEVAKGVLHLLGGPTAFDGYEASWNVEKNCPDQWTHNAYGSKDGWGACGPFVYKTVELLLASIRRAQDIGGPCYAQLKLEFPPGWHINMGFDSKATRIEIRNVIVSAKRKQLWHEECKVMGFKDELEHAIAASVGESGTDMEANAPSNSDTKSNDENVSSNRHHMGEPPLSLLADGLPSSYLAGHALPSDEETSGSEYYGGLTNDTGKHQGHVEYMLEAGEWLADIVIEDSEASDWENESRAPVMGTAQNPDIWIPLGEAASEGSDGGVPLSMGLAGEAISMGEDDDGSTVPIRLPTLDLDYAYGPNSGPS